MNTTAINKYILLYTGIYSTLFFLVMWHQILYFLQNLVMVPLLLFTNKERSSSERRMEGGIDHETSMSPFECECFGSARLLKDNHRRGYTRA